MPNANRVQSLYVSAGNPDSENITTAYLAATFRSGEIGMSMDVNDRTYTRVVLDSGATAATATGVVAANQLAFWKDRSQYLVTNDSKQSDLGATNFRNSVAGIFRTAVTAGNSCFILIRGRKISVKGTAGAVGDQIIANSGTNADTTNISAGSAFTYQILGVCAVASTDSANVTVDVDIPNIP